MNSIISLRERFGGEFKIEMEEGYFAQYGPDARIDDPHYQIIPGGRGHVFAWNGDQLAASSNTAGSTATKLKRLPFVRIFQDGSDGSTVIFPMRHLDEVASILRLRRKRRVTDDERKRLREIGKQHWFHSTTK